MPQAFGLYFHETRAAEKTVPPLLLVHGAGGTHLSWSPEIRRLNGYRVLAPDLPGHGKSGGLSGLQRIQDYAKWLHRWMAEMRIGQAVLAGHSMGGAIVLSMALQYPESVAGLMLVATGARLPVNQLLLEETASPVAFLKSVQHIIDWSFGSETPPRLVELVRQRMVEGRQNVLHSDLRACNEFDVVADLMKITCPTLAVCGTEDRMTPVRFSQYLASSIPNAQLELIPRAGHMVMLERPREVARAMERFMEEQVQNREVV